MAPSTSTKNSKTAPLTEPPQYKINYFLYIIGIIFGVGAGTYLFFTRNQFIIPLLRSFDADYAYLSKTFDTETKVKLFIKVLFYFGIHLFATTILIGQLRIFMSKANPVQDEDPTIIKTLNRSIGNSIEQGISFFAFFLYFLFFRAKAEHFDELYGLAAMFLFARVSFMVFYYVGIILRIASLRSIGFGINLLINARLFELIFGINILGMIQPYFI